MYVINSNAFMHAVSNLPGGKAFFKAQGEVKSKKLLNDLVKIVFSKWAVNRQQQHEVVVPVTNQRSKSVDRTVPS